jgi:hypothetical protein
MQPSQPPFEHTTVVQNAIAEATGKETGPAAAGHKEEQATSHPFGLV